MYVTRVYDANYQLVRHFDRYEWGVSHTMNSIHLAPSIQRARGVLKKNPVVRHVHIFDTTTGRICFWHTKRGRLGTR